MNIQLAYLLGAYLGDGNIWKCQGNHKCYETKVVSLDRDVLEYFAECATSQFVCSANVRRCCEGKYWQVKVSNKSLMYFLEEETGTKKALLPIGIKSWTREEQVELVAGLMDTDGYISLSKTRLDTPRWTMGFVNSADWFWDFRELLQSLGVKCGKATLKRKYRSSAEKDCYQLHINTRSFIDAGLLFRCQRKQERLLSYASKFI